MSETTSISRLQELLPQLFQSTQLPGEAYVRCQLTPDVSALVSMAWVQESLLVPSEQITPVPNMSPYVVGLMSSRSRVFCAIDLPQLLGLAPASGRGRDYHTVTIRVPELGDESTTSERELLIGLVVYRLQGIARVIAEEMEAPQTDFPTTLTPYIRGWTKDRERALPILDVAAIVKQAI